MSIGNLNKRVRVSGALSQALKSYALTSRGHRVGFSVVKESFG